MTAISRLSAIPVVRGRNFAANETERVAIVDERFARTYWPDGNALGERLRYAQTSPEAGTRSSASCRT